MITSLESLTYESTGFNLLEEGNDNPSGTTLWFCKKANYSKDEIPTTYEEVCDDGEDLCYMEGDNAELDSLIFDPLTNLEFPMDLERIDLEHPICMYEMSYVGYDWKWKEPKGPIKRQCN